MRRLCDVHWSMVIMVSGTTQVPDIDLFDADVLNGYVNTYEPWLSI